MREIAAVPLERLVGAFGVLRRDALVAAHLAQRLQVAVPREPGVAEDPPELSGRLRHRQQHVLDRHVVVLQGLGLFFGRAHDSRQLARERHLRGIGARAGQARQLADRASTWRLGLGIGPGFGQNVGRDAALLFEQSPRACAPA